MCADLWLPCHPSALNEEFPSVNIISRRDLQVYFRDQFWQALPPFDSGTTTTTPLGVDTTMIESCLANSNAAGGLLGYMQAIWTKLEGEKAGQAGVKVHAEPAT